ncbi:MAG: hypothetical protein U9N39_04540 [Campylobacterota bacterium]|nr:hypothetical protein [Campylobacterota bacterium]
MIKNITLALLVSLLFIGCSKDDENLQNVKPKLVIGKTVEVFNLQDQFEVSHSLSPDTNKLIFAFGKESAHTCNDFFNTQKPSYLKEHHTLFIADVSAAPSLIRSMFILPGLKDFKHTVLLLDDKAVAAPFRKDMNTEAVVVVYLNNNQISEIKTLNSVDELKKVLEDGEVLN